MTTDQEISKIEDELEGARGDLRDTMAEVNHKVERAEVALYPEQLVRSYPVGASCLAGALGFLIGSMTNNRVAGPAVMIALLGYAISERISKNGSAADGREPASKR